MNFSLYLRSNLTLAPPPRLDSVRSRGKQPYGLASAHYMYSTFVHYSVHRSSAMLKFSEP